MVRPVFLSLLCSLSVSQINAAALSNNYPPLPNAKACHKNYVSCSDDPINAPSCCGPVSTHTCLDPTTHLCCPKGWWGVNGICCPQDKTECGGKCCAGPCNAGVCESCPSGEYPVMGLCCPGPNDVRCWQECCGEGHHCSWLLCCPDGTDWNFTSGKCCPGGLVC